MTGLSRTVLATLLIAAVFLSAGPAVEAQGSSGTTLFGGDFVLQAGERLSHDLVVFGGQAHLMADSLVEGNVVFIGGELVLEGRVRGDVVAMGSSLRMGSTALIDGDLVTFGHIERHPQATVRGNIVEGLEAGLRIGSLTNELETRAVPRQPTPARTLSPFLASLANLIRRAAIVVGLALLAAIALMLVPDNVHRVAQVMTASWSASLGVGILTVATAAVAAPLLVITCIGAPLAVILGASLAICALIGWIAAGHLLGERLLNALGMPERSLLTSGVAGTALITLASMVPCVGIIVAVLVGCWGMGAVVLTRFGTQPYPQADASPAPASRPDTRRLASPWEDEPPGAS